MNSLQSHLQFNINQIPDIIQGKKVWKKYPNLHRLDNINLQDGNKNLKSGNNWTNQHMQAFHIIKVLDLEIKNVLPIEFMVNNDELFNKLSLLWSMDRDNLYNKHWEKFYNKNVNISLRDKTDIITCLNLLVNLIDRNKRTDYDISSTSDEGDNLEYETQTFASNLCKTFLSILELYKKYPPTWKFVNNSANYTHHQIKILGNIMGNARNDGAIVYIGDNKQASPVIWIEVKPLEYAPRLNSQKAYDKIIPQKAAEALSFAQSHWKKLGATIKDQETFGIEFNHRYATFWHALFPREYLLNVYYQPVLDYNNVVALKRTRVFDLIESTDRKEFSKCLVGLLNYVSNGNPLIGPY
ncbi:unnamed protein product [Cunninghamella echinulata]